MGRALVSNAEIASEFSLSAQDPSAAHAVLVPAADETAAESHTRLLARTHYENFPVVSLLLPRHLRQDFCNIYAFCRVADDFADELADPAQALRRLLHLRDLTRACFAGHATTALFLALSATIRRHDLPPEPFLDLIDAFEQDQRLNRYETFDQLLDYCRRSADPVGRLVLYICGYRDPDLHRLSDRTCTALQLTNFWQDVRRDLLERNRVYLPGESMARFSVTEEQLRNGRCDDNYRNLIRFEVQRTADLFCQGDPLLPRLRPAVRKHIALFAQGGRAILEAIRRQNYDTLTRRPTLSRWQKGRLVASAFAQHIACLLIPGGRS